jgi:hypothetical protein
MFGRQNRKHLQALEELHEELTAEDFRARAVLNDAIAQIDMRLARDREDRERAQLSTQTAIENSQSLITAQATDVGRLLQQVANTCALVAERVEVDRYERRALTEAIARLAQLPVTPLESREHALGGTVVPPSQIADDSEPHVEEKEIDLRDPADPRVGAGDASPVEHRWTYGPPTDESVDRRPHEDAQSTSRPHSNWSTRQS